jgi:hypothetical protein
MIEGPPGNDWRGLQDRVASILRESGFDAKVGAHLPLARGAVAIDVLATDPSTVPPALYLCECKRWRANVPQAEVQTFRTIVADAGAHFGLFISSRGFQSGARDVVRHTNIHLLDWAEFQSLFVERWCRRYWVPTVRREADRMAGYAEMPGNDAPLRYHHGEPIEPAEAVGLFVLDLWGEPFNDLIGHIEGRALQSVAEAIWRHREQYRQFLPPPVVAATTLRELLEAILGFSQAWLRETGRIA